MPSPLYMNINMSMKYYWTRFNNPKGCITCKKMPADTGHILMLKLFEFPIFMITYVQRTIEI